MFIRLTRPAHRGYPVRDTKCWADPEAHGGHVAAGYSAERDMAEAALAQERVDRSSRFPPASEHLRAAREARGLTQRQLADKFGPDGNFCPDLELYDDELFTCIDVDDL